MSERRSANQSPRIIGRRAGEILATHAVQGAVLLILFTGVGAYLTIGVQQIIKAYGNESLYNDPAAIHNMSVFPLCLIAIAIGLFGGKSAQWILSCEWVRMSGVGLGLIGGFAVYQLLAIYATGSKYYFPVLVVLAITSLGMFIKSGGYKKIRLVHQPHPGQVF